MPVSKNRDLRMLWNKVNSLFTTNFSMPIIGWYLAGSVIFGLIYAVVWTVNPDLAIAIERWCHQLEISFLAAESTVTAPVSLFGDLALTAIKMAFLVAIVTIAARTFPQKNS